MKLRRSLLLAPGDDSKMLARLATGQQDVSIIDLEDAVHPSRKEAARALLREVLVGCEWASSEQVVRINAVGSDDCANDIDAAVEGKASGVMVPKVQSTDEIRQVSLMLAAAEARHGLEAGSTAIWSMIETALGLMNVYPICTADPRLTAIMLGGADLALDLKVKRIGLGSNRATPFPPHEYVYARGKIIASARAAGVDPIDVGFSSFEDAERTRVAAEYSAQMGFSGVFAFNWRQVPIINNAMSPSAHDLNWARRVLSEFEGANGVSGRVAALIDGEIVEGPFVEDARTIVARAEAADRAGGAPLQ